ELTVEDGERLQPSLEVMFHRPGGEVLDLGGRGRRWLGQRRAQLPAEDLLQQHDRFGSQRGSPAMFTAQHATFVRVERAEAFGLTTEDTGVDRGPETLDGEQLPEERRRHERMRISGERAQRP